MKTIYFPFTYVPDAVAEVLALCFKQTIVYQPLADELPESMQSWIKKGILNIRTPVTDNQETLKKAAAAYLNWANLHQNGSAVKAAFISAQNRIQSFSDPSSSSHIVAEIKDDLYGRRPSKEQVNLFRARIFLYFAQQYDQQHQSISNDLEAFQNQEKEFIQVLKKEANHSVADLASRNTQALDESAGYMPIGRLDAWAQIYLKDSIDAALFVTTSRSVLEEVIEQSSKIEIVARWESIPLSVETLPEMDIWRDQLISDLTRVAETKWSKLEHRLKQPSAMPSAERCVSLEVYVVPDCDPRRFFKQYTDVDPNRDDMMPADTQFHNTIIGLLETSRNFHGTPKSRLI